MKPLRYLAVSLGFSMVFSAASTFATGTKTVLLTNNTSYTVSEVYASSSDSSAFGTTNLVAGQTINPGQQMTITIADSSSSCVYDLMAVLYGAGQYAYQYQINTCSGGSWTISQ